MRQGIINTLQPFVTGEDAMTGMITHTIRKMLQRATVEQLVEVLLSAKGFVDEMEPLLNEATNARHVDADSGSDSDGSGTDSGGQSLREVDPISANHPAFLAEVQRKVSGTGSGYETPMEGDENRNGSTTQEAV